VKGLIERAERYKELRGYYPGRICADLILGLLKKAIQLCRNWFQRLRAVKLASDEAIVDCCY
jgi:hypothetical protein